MILKNIFFAKQQLLNLIFLLPVLFFVNFNLKAQTITCPAETILGTISCHQIGDPTIPQIQEIPGLEQVMMPPYNMVISGILPQTGLVVEDSAPIAFCLDDAREVIRLITIYNDYNLNFVYDVGEEIGSCSYNIMTEALTELPSFTAPADIETNCALGTGVEVTGEPVLSPNACQALFYEATFTDNYADASCEGGDNILSRRWLITDACGNESEAQSQTIVIKSRPPEFTVPADITIFCGSDPMDTSITGDVTDATDECGNFLLDAVSVIVDELTQEDTPCPGSTTYTKRWAAVDGCGTATFKDQIIVVECPPDCSNQDICLGDILADPLPGECDCQVVERQVLGCTDVRCYNYDPAVNCDDGSCSFKVFDLALVKEISSIETFMVGSSATITFTITIYNQGDLGAQNIEIVDYLPNGLILNDANWTTSGANAVISIAGPLKPQESISVDISFTIDPTAPAGTYTNFTEIFGAQDILGNPGQEIDSTPDMNNDNDVYNTPLYYSDEDDHDGAEFTLEEAASCPNNNAGYFCE